MWYTVMALLTCWKGGGDAVPPSALSSAADDAWCREPFVSAACSAAESAAGPVLNSGRSFAPAPCCMSAAETPPPDCSAICAAAGSKKAGLANALPAPPALLAAPPGTKKPTCSSQLAACQQSRCANSHHSSWQMLALYVASQPRASTAHLGSSRVGSGWRKHAGAAQVREGSTRGLWLAAKSADCGIASCHPAPGRAHAACTLRCAVVAPAGQHAVTH